MHINAMAGANGGKRQADACIHGFIDEWLENDIKLRLQAKQNLVTVMVNQAPIVHESGLMMLCNLVSIVSAQTRATISLWKSKLSCLDAIMEDSKNDVRVFNDEVELILKKLRARETSAGDILTNLLMAHKMCEDEEFVKCIKRKEDNHEEHTITLTQTSIMKLALNECKALVEKGQWSQKTPQELEFVTMKAELADTCKKLQQTGKQQKQPSNKPVNGNTGKFAWKNIAPKPGEPHFKTANGKEHIHCPNHVETVWVLKTNGRRILHSTGCLAMKKQLEKAGDKISPTKPTPGLTVSGLTANASELMCAPPHANRRRTLVPWRQS